MLPEPTVGVPAVSTAGACVQLSPSDDTHGTADPTMGNHRPEYPPLQPNTVKEAIVPSGDVLGLADGTSIV
jgi:hypothetical protein